MNAVTMRAPHPAAAVPARPSRIRGLLDAIAERWRRMDGPGDGRRVAGTGVVAVTAMTLQTAIAGISVGSGAALWYADAMSHLVIAGRITSGFNAGVQQLGTVWLPAPHLLLAPLASNHVLWATGWAGAIVGILAMGASTAALYRIAARVGLRRAGRLVTVLLFVANPGVLYVYTTALTEPVLLAGLLGCIAGLAHYAVARRPLSGGELAVYAGIPAAIAVLSRYEGWVIVAAGVLCIMIMELRARHRLGRRALLRGASFALPPLAAVAVIPLLAISWWLGYNFVNFGDALEFVVGEYSAFAQQRDLAAANELSTEGSLAASLTVLGGSTWQVAGWVAIGLGLLGCAWLAATDGLGTRTLIAGVLLAPWVFNVAALYLGQTVIRNEFSVPPGHFNSRYALTALAFLALCAGVLVDALADGPVGRRLGRLRHAVAPVAALAILGQAVFVAAAPTERSPIIEEGRVQQTARELVDPVWDYLAEHYDGTGVLTDEVATTMQPRLGVPLGDFYILAAGEHFEQALARPTQHVGWILVSTADRSREYHQDAVREAMLESPENFTAYQPVAAAEEFVLYRNGSRP